MNSEDIGAPIDSVDVQLRNGQRATLRVIRELGLARQLLEMLVPLARASGFQRMEGYILATNVRMLSLAKRLGFTEMASSEGPTIRMVRRDLRTAP